MIRRATDGAQDGPAFFTEGAMLRLEEGLRAQREQQERRHFSEPDAASSRIGSSGGRQPEEQLRNNVGEVRRTIIQLSRGGAHGRGVQTIDSAEQTFPYKDWILRYASAVALERGSGTRREADHDAPSFELHGYQDSRRSIENLHRVGPGPRLRDEIAHRRSPYWRWLKVDLLLCILLLIVGAAALGVSLKVRTRGSTDAPPVNIKAHGRTASVSPDNDQLHQPITNAVKSPAATPSLPPPSPVPPNQQPVEAQAPATPAASETPVTPSLPPPSPVPPNKQPAEAQGPAKLAASERPAASPQCNIPVCQQFYRSFRRSDCTYQPFSGGPRRICDR